MVIQCQGSTTFLSTLELKRLDQNLSELITHTSSNMYITLKYELLICYSFSIELPH